MDLYRCGLRHTAWYGSVGIDSNPLLRKTLPEYGKRSPIANNRKGESSFLFRLIIYCYRLIKSVFSPQNRETCTPSNLIHTSFKRLRNDQKSTAKKKRDPKQKKASTPPNALAQRPIHRVAYVCIPKITFKRSESYLFPTLPSHPWQSVGRGKENIG